MMEKAKARHGVQPGALSEFIDGQSKGPPLVANIADTRASDSLFGTGSDPFSQRCPYTGELLRLHDAPLHFGFTTDADAWAFCDALGIRSRNRMQARAVHGIATALVVEALGRRRATSYSRNREYPLYRVDARYRQDGFGYGPILAAVDLLKDAGMIGDWRAPAGIPTGIQSTIWALPELVEAVTRFHIAPIPPKELIELRDSDGRPMAYRDTARTRRMRRALETFNEAVENASFEWSGGVFKNLFMRRIFTERLSYHGRAYGIGENIQNIPKEDRASILINGEATAEVDFTAMHAHLAYIEAGAVMDGDPYILLGEERNDRKLALNILFNADGEGVAIRALAHKLENREMHAHYKALNRDRRRHGLPEVTRPKGRYATRGSISHARRLVDGAKAKHPRIAKALHTNAGLRFMRTDSEIAARVQGYCLRNGEIAAPLHDSFRVRMRATGVLRNAMAQASKAVTGTEIPCADFVAITHYDKRKTA